MYETDKELAAISAVANTAPTMGFDTVFAVSTAAINQAIVDAGSSPRTLDWPQQGPLKFGLTADIDHWKMVSSGDGDKIHFALPLSNLKAPYVLQGKPGTLTCAQAVAYISVGLDILPHDGPAILPDKTTMDPPENGAIRHAVKVRLTSNAPQDPIVSLVKLDFIAPLSDPEGVDQIKSMVEDWARQHLKDFEHVFAFVDLNDQIDTGPWAFCRPTKSTYAYVDSVSGDDGHLALLCMTTDNPLPPIQQVSKFAIPAGCDAAFLISMERFMMNMLLPGFKYIWPSLTDDMLIFKSNPPGLELKSGQSLQMKDFTLKNGNVYTPVLTHFSAELVDNIIKVQTKTDVEVFTGIHGTCDSTNWLAIGLSKKGAGKQRLVTKPVKPAVVVTGHYESRMIKAVQQEIQEIEDILMKFVGIPVAEIEEVAAVAILMCEVGKQFLYYIAKGAGKHAPDFEALSQAMSKPMVWNGKHLDITTPQLNGSLQLGGTFQ